MVWETTIDQDGSVGTPVEDGGGGETTDDESGDLHNEEIETEENK